MEQDKKHEPSKTKSPEKIEKTTNDGNLSDEELNQVSGGSGTVSKF